MKENHSTMTKNRLIKQIVWLGMAQVSDKGRRFYLPEDKRVAEDIKEKISNRLKVFSRWIKDNMRRYILNYY